MMQIRKSFLLVLSMVVINPLFKPCVAGGCNRERSMTPGSVYCEHHECHAEGCKHRALAGEEYCELHFFAEK